MSTMPPLCTGTVSFKGTTMLSTNLDGAVLAGADFTNTILRNATFNDAYLVNATFNGADLQNVRFNRARLQGVEFATALISGVSLANAAVSVTDTQAMSSLNTCGLSGPGAWTFVEQDGMPITFGFSETVLDTLATTLVKITFTCPDSGVSGRPCGCPDGQPCATLGNLCPMAPPFPPISGNCTLDARACCRNCFSDFDCCTACKNCWSGDCSICLSPCG